jgi:glutamate synthase (NADPH) small chain
VIGGGDTGADCVGWAHRDGAASVVQLAHGKRPPETRDPVRTWPEWPWVLRTYPAHEEGGVREWLVETERLAGADGRVAELHGRRVDTGEPFTIDADLVLLAIGFRGAEPSPLLADLGIELGARGTIAARPGGATRVPGVFAAGDCVRGADLVVTAIADGRRAADAVDAHVRASAA